MSSEKATCCIAEYECCKTKDCCKDGPINCCSAGNPPNCCKTSDVCNCNGNCACGVGCTGIESCNCGSGCSCKQK